ncbi:MAG: LmbE family N-acetylglucosaminyl deacetylase [Pseudohongiellaceae bacterium]|jgi:LmbE family N-acetylglucosaminyl deacetylase
MTALGPAQGFPPLYDLSRVPVGQVLVVAPHPDDEILGCGGAIAAHVARGDGVHVALVTGGEAGGDSTARLAESRKAAACLGHTEVTCFSVSDGHVAADAGWAARLSGLLDELQPRVVYAPSPFEMHPDHVATLDVAAAALEGRTNTTLLLYEVNAEQMATFLLDITPVAELKHQALSVFASQLGMIDIVAKADARCRARTVNVDIPAVTHAEGYLELRPEDVPAVRQELCALAARLGLASGG